MIADSVKIALLVVRFRDDKATLGRNGHVLGEEVLQGQRFSLGYGSDSKPDVLGSQIISLCTNLPQIPDKRLSCPDSRIITLKKYPVAPITGRNAE